MERLVIIIIYWTLPLLFFANTSDVSCPKRCACRTRRLLTQLGHTYFVNCKRRAFTKIPDISCLSKNALPKRLDLSRNRISSISRNDFSSDMNIAMLFLGHNEDVNMTDGAFINLAGSLEFLGLRNVRLRFDSPFAFLRGLSKLKKLILNHNGQKNDGVIANNVFRGLGLASLEYVSVYNCHVIGIGNEAFAGAESLEELDMTFNWLKEVPRALKCLRNLKKLTLRLNNVKRIHRNSFEGMSSLRHLDLSQNGGLKLEEGALVGLEESLETLVMRTCQLDDVPTAGIRDLTALKTLNVAYNPLSDVSSTSLEGSYCLQTLDISKTLMPLEASILEPQKTCLVSIFINDKGLTEVPRRFLANMTELRHVSLSKNRICVLKTESLKGIRANSYDFSDNCLYKIEANVFEGKRGGISLALKRTNVTDVLFVLPYKEKTFQHIWLEGIDMNCDCSLFDAMRASQPFALKGQCRLNAESKKLQDYEFKAFLKNNCTVENIDPVVVVTNGSRKFLSSIFLVFFVCVV